MVHVRQGLPRPVMTVVGHLDLTGAGLLSAMVEHVGRTRQASGGVDVDVDLSVTTLADLLAPAPAPPAEGSRAVPRVRRQPLAWQGWNE